MGVGEKGEGQRAKGDGRRAKVAVVGGGITGLTIAYKEKKKGNDVALFESSSRVGGKICSIYSEGIELDLGPITIAETPELLALADELNLEVVEASNASKIRYIYSRGKLHNVRNIITGSLLSFGGKLAMLKGLFTNKEKNGSVAEYVTKRFGNEAYQRLFNPLMNGIYAGNSELLSANAVIKNRKPRKIVSLKGGITALTNALALSLGESIHTGRAISRLNELDDFDEVHLTTPAFTTAQLVPELSIALRSIHYSSVTQIYCEAVPGAHKFDGFGFLVPSEEKMSLLGAICVSNIFPWKVPDGRRLFVLFCGGDRPYDLTPSVEDAVNEFKRILNPALVKVIHVQEFSNGIPQFYSDHNEIIGLIKEFELKNPRIKIKGNYVTGVAVGDCI